MLKNAELLIFSLMIFISLAGMMFLIFRSGVNSQSGDDSIRLRVRLLYFAAAVLSGLGLIFMQSMAMYYFSCDSGGCIAGSENPGKEIFTACTQIIPPIATLILGYYFGKLESK